MKKILVLLLILVGLTSCEKEKVVNKLEFEHLRLVEEIKTDDQYLYQLYKVDQSYKVIKFGMDGKLVSEFILSDEILDLDENSYGVSTISLYVEDSNVGLIYSVDNDDNLYFALLNNDMTMDKVLVVDYSDLVLNPNDNQLFLVDDELYLLNDYELVSYTIISEGLNEVNRLDFSGLSNVNLAIDDSLYLLGTISEDSLVVGLQDLEETSGKVVLKIDSDLAYDSFIKLDTSIEEANITVNDVIYIYGKTITSPVVVTYSTDLVIENSYSLGLGTTGYIYGINNLQFKNDSIYAVMEKINSVVTIFKLDIENESYEELYTEQFLFSLPNYENIIDVTDKYILINNEDYLYVVNAK
ncbi:hypothetical protein CI105_07985 [Candidatus Izimaplasma bacterium ZiA1]|uniref:hypothetical protein n=1 Tax=Candidatus Izimoplasma sp. ZiA1 TaxID=2024899 RepID=UPI000BAA3F87|nr:hypothetical protein CI105_07985 [Candidatus Izimaplasma bacterium ZiA1]